MEATAERIRRHGFGRPRYFETLICRRGRTPIGFALYYFTYSTFLGRPTLYLEDLFVLAEARGNGAGRALLRALAKVAVRRGCGLGGAHAGERQGGGVPAAVVAVHPADGFDVPLVLVGVEHVDRELDHIGELATGRGDEGAEVLAHLAELGNQVALAHDAPVLVLRDLTGEEQEATAACLDAVGVADGLRERRRVVELDLPRHRFLPSRTIVCPLVASSSSRFRTAA